MHGDVETGASGGVQLMLSGSGTDDGPCQQKSTKGGAEPSPRGIGLGALPEAAILYFTSTFNI
jgi:hypothetical protein